MDLIVGVSLVLSTFTYVALLCYFFVLCKFDLSVDWLERLFPGEISNVLRLDIFTETRSKKCALTRILYFHVIALFIICNSVGHCCLGTV